MQLQSEKKIVVFGIVEENTKLSGQMFVPVYVCGVESETQLMLAVDL